MNILRFLKSTKGAIKPLNALIISGVAGVGFFYVANTAADRHIEADRATRSLTSISQTAPQAGMHRSGNLLTSINVRDGRNQLATADERAAMEGNNALSRYNANQRALGEMDGALGRAAQFSDSDAGLNTGNRNAVQDPTRFEVGNPNASAGGIVVESRPAASSGGAAPQGQDRLANASITRASGNSFNATSGAVSGGIATQGGIRSGSEGRRLSGAMPGGSNIVSQRGLDGALASNRNLSSFGQGRNARLGRGRNARGDRDELKDIVKRSADAAGNANASANEGGRAFLANARNSGGVSVDGGEDMTRGASSGDLAAPTAHKLKAVGNKLNEVDKKIEEMNQDRRSLTTQLIATVLGSIGMMVAGALILGRLDKTIEAWKFEAAVATLPADKAACLAMVKMFTLRRWLTAAVMMAAVAAANTLLFIKAAEFMDRYNSMGGTGIAKLAVILSPIMVAGMVYTAIKPGIWKSLGTKIWTKIKSAFDPVGMLTSQVTNGFMGLFK